MSWNFNIDEAPKSKTVKKKVKTADGFEMQDVEVPVRIFACVDNPEKWSGVTYWTKPTRWTPKGRWSGLTEDQTLLGWMPIPDHPYVNKQDD